MGIKACWWDFVSGSSYLQSQITALGIPTGNYTAMVMVKAVGTPVTLDYPFCKSEGSNWMWRFTIDSGDDVEAETQIGGASKGGDINNGLDATQIQLYALVKNGTDHACYIVDSGGVQVDSEVQSGSITFATSKVGIAARIGGTYQFNGKIYMVFFKDGLVATPTQLQNIYNETLDPATLSPTIYETFEKAVANPYTILTSQVFDVIGTPVAGGTPTPTFSLAEITTVSPTRLKFRFDVGMTKADLEDKTNFTISSLGSGVAVTVASVVVPDVPFPTYVFVDVNEHTTSESYRGTVDPLVEDKDGTAIGSVNNKFDYDGLGDTPEILSVTSTSRNTIEIKFSESMTDNADINDEEKYTFDKGLTTVSVSGVVGDTVTLVTSEQEQGEVYTLTITQ